MSVGGRVKLLQKHETFTVNFDEEQNNFLQIFQSIGTLRQKLGTSECGFVQSVAGNKHNLWRLNRFIVQGEFNDIVTVSCCGHYFLVISHIHFDT